MTVEYVEEKLREAVRILATGSGRIQERLADAALVLIRLRPEEVPEGPLRRSLIGIIGELTPTKGEEGSINGMRKITDDEDARAIAKRIVALYNIRAELTGKNEKDGALRGE